MNEPKTYAEQAYFDTLERQADERKNRDYYDGGRIYIQAPIGQDVLVQCDGKTNLHNRYIPFPPGKAGPGGSGVYSMKRSMSTFRSILRVHSAASIGKHCYFITHTMGPQYSNEERRTGFRRLLDRLRKSEGYLGHVWCTEYHSDGLRIHHHVFVRFNNKWNYRSNVVEWSQNYCGSINGLDVKPIQQKGNGVFKYMFKTFAYMLKSAGDTKTLPFRWWGTSKVIRSVMLKTGQVPLYSKTRYNDKANWNNIVARTDELLAANICGRLTGEDEVVHLQRR